MLTPEPVTDVQAARTERLIRTALKALPPRAGLIVIYWTDAEAREVQAGSNLTHPGDIVEILRDTATIIEDGAGEVRDARNVPPARKPGARP